MAIISKVDPYIKNPFHPQAVATYGTTFTATFENLRYIGEVRDHLFQYMSNYEDLESKGATVGILGAHGSGKTHLLNLIANDATVKSPSLKCKVLYAKADSTSFFDLYKQLICEKTLPRTELIKVIDSTIVKMAKEQVSAAMITMPVQRRIKSEEDVVNLHREGNVDLNDAKIALETKLKSEGIPEMVVTMLKSIKDPHFGNTAYNWIIGTELENTTDLGVNFNLRQLSDSGIKSTDSDSLAITMLEAICALYKIAGIPLILMIDQFEGLILADDKERQNSLYSLIKKLIEQTNRQKALVFIAGNPQSWENLPRDVGPRMRTRQPIIVGNLTKEEMTGLLQEYFRESNNNYEKFYSDEALEKLFDISGGNAREIICISFHAFEDNRGDLSAATASSVLACSKRSGTVADKKVLCLKLADPVLQGFGDVVQDMYIGDNTVIDRVVTIDSVPTLGILVVTAIDQLDEVNVAQKIQNTIEFAIHRWPRFKLLAVAVGYSSEEIRDKLEPVARVIKFNEEIFSRQLRTELVDVQSKVIVEEKNDKAFSSLRSVKATRQSDINKTRDRFERRTNELMSKELAEKESKTKWEMTEKLDALEGYLKEVNNFDMERRIIRSILISNEIYIHNPGIEKLGTLYLDVISTQENYSIPNNDLEDSDQAARIARDLKFDILSMTRGNLLKPGLVESLIQSRISFILRTAAISLALLFSFYLSQELHYDSQFVREYWVTELIYRLPYLLAFAFAIAVGLYFTLDFLSRLKYYRLNRGHRNLRSRTASVSAHAKTTSL